MGTQLETNHKHLRWLLNSVLVVAGAHIAVLGGYGVYMGSSSLLLWSVTILYFALGGYFSFLVFTWKERMAKSDALKRALRARQHDCPEFPGEECLCQEKRITGLSYD